MYISTYNFILVLMKIVGFSNNLHVNKLSMLTRYQIKTVMATIVKINLPVNILSDNQCNDDIRNDN